MTQYRYKACFVFIILFLNISTTFVLGSDDVNSTEVKFNCTPEIFKNDIEIVEACYDIHGRISGYNGGPPNLRMWIIDTTRLLGISYWGWLSENKLFWDNFNFDTSVYGDFRVCPVSKYKKGHMQYVCVESGKNLVIKKHIGHWNEEGKNVPEVYKLKETWE